MSEHRATDDETWYDVACVIAKRSRCVRSQVGCVIVDPAGRVVATGYNGPAATWAPRGLTYLPSAMRCDSFCPRALDETSQGMAQYSNCVSIHAELNALLVSDRRHIEGGTLYTSRIPCGDCAKAIANSGLKRVVYGPMPPGKTVDVHLHAQEGMRLLYRAGIDTMLFES